MMERIVEPELMDDREQARAYAEADFEDAHENYVRQFRQLFPDAPSQARTLDIGCGPGDVTRRFARAYPGWTLHGLDGSPAMLAEFQKSLAAAPDLAARIRLIEGILPETNLPAGQHDVILSTSLLHQLHEPQMLWQTIRRYARYGTAVFVADLLRPAAVQDAAALVAGLARDEPVVLQRDFYNSLRAAFTPAEVQAQLSAARLDTLEIKVLDGHHLVVWGRMPL